MKILNLGSCNLDFVYSLDHIVEVGETENASLLELFPGGKGLNQSIAVARAGAPVYHAGCVGHDGEILINTLIAAGVDVSYINTAFDTIDRVHGGMDAFLKNQLGLDESFINELCQNYLE